MIIKKEKKNGINILYVSKDKTNAEMDKLANTLVTSKLINYIIDEDTDVYTEDNKILLAFRKKKLNDKHVKTFYDNVIKFAQNHYSLNRGSTSASKSKNIYDNPKVYSNVIGYMDTFSPSQKVLLKKKGITLKYSVRECMFNMYYPDNYKKLIPLVQDIDYYYKALFPNNYKKQHKKANQTYFKVAKTSFTTITTNVNFQTSIHKDRGDDAEGFGNLTVIENGEYTGAETCMPQYGVGVNVRTGDILFMDVHEWHGNLPMVKKDKDAIRLSVVCYLRTNVWKNTRNVTKAQMMKHNKTVRSIRKNKL